MNVRLMCFEYRSRSRSWTISIGSLPVEVGLGPAGLRVDACRPAGWPRRRGRADRAGSRPGSASRRSPRSGTSRGPTCPRRGCRGNRRHRPCRTRRGRAGARSPVARSRWARPRSQRGQGRRVSTVSTRRGRIGEPRRSSGCSRAQAGPGRPDWAGRGDRDQDLLSAAPW